MSEHLNLGLARRLLAAFEAGDESAVDELIHPIHREHAWAGAPPGPDSVRDAIRWVSATFDDRRLVMEDLIASDDRVVARVRFSGTQHGPAFGLEPTGRQVDTDEVHIWRVADGRLAEHWMVRDDLSAIRQLTGQEALHAH